MVVARMARSLGPRLIATLLAFYAMAGILLAAAMLSGRDARFNWGALGGVAALFAGTRGISVRQHTLAIAEWLGGSTTTGLADLELANAVVVGAIVIILATLLAIRRLQEVELRGETA